MKIENFNQLIKAVKYLIKTIGSGINLKGSTATPSNPLMAATDEVRPLFEVRAAYNSATSSGASYVSTYFGDESGKSAGNTQRNTAFGSKTLRSAIDGGRNSAFGTGALKDLTSGWYNCAFGDVSMPVLTTGQENTAFGWGSLIYLKGGWNNVAVGNNTLDRVVDTSGNVAVGAYAGRYATGNGNLFLGNRAGATVTDVSNRMYIANSDTVNPLLYGEFDNAYLKVNGRFGVTTINEYADNATAKAAGLANGDFYRTGEVLKVVF